MEKYLIVTRLVSPPLHIHENEILPVKLPMVCMECNGRKYCGCRQCSFIVLSWMTKVTFRIKLNVVFECLVRPVVSFWVRCSGWLLSVVQINVNFKAHRRKLHVTYNNNRHIYITLIRKQVLFLCFCGAIYIKM